MDIYHILFTLVDGHLSLSTFQLLSVLNICAQVFLLKMFSVLLVNTQEQTFRCRENEWIDDKVGFETLSTLFNISRPVFCVPKMKELHQTLSQVFILALKFCNSIITIFYAINTYMPYGWMDGWMNMYSFRGQQLLLWCYCGLRLACYSLCWYDMDKNDCSIFKKRRIFRRRDTHKA